MTQKQLICSCMIGSDKVAECLGSCKDHVYTFCEKQFIAGGGEDNASGGEAGPTQAAAAAAGVEAGAGLSADDACAAGNAECAAAASADKHAHSENIYNAEQMARLRVDAKG